MRPAIITVAAAPLRKTRSVAATTRPAGRASFAAERVEAGLASWACVGSSNQWAAFALFASFGTWPVNMNTAVRE